MSTKAGTEEFLLIKSPLKNNLANETSIIGGFNSPPSPSPSPSEPAEASIPFHQGFGFKVVKFAILSACAMSGFMINSIALEDIGLSSIVLTSIILNFADFFANIIMYCTYHRLKRRKGLIGFNCVVFVLSALLLMLSLWCTSSNLKLYNLVIAFIIKIFFLLTLILTVLYGGKSFVSKISARLFYFE